MYKKLYNARKFILIIASIVMVLSVALILGLKTKVYGDTKSSDWLTDEETISYVTFDEYGNKTIKDLTNNTQNGFILSDSSTVVNEVKEILLSASTYEGKIWIVIDTPCKLTGTITIDGNINFVITGNGSLDLSEVKLAYTKDSANLSVYYSIDNENSDSPFNFKTYKEKYLYVDKTGKQEERWIYNYRLYPNDPTNDRIKEQVHYFSELKGGYSEELIWDTWWILDKDYTFNNTSLRVGGFNNIILKNGCTLTVKKIYKSSSYYADKSLNIYAETLDQTKAGSLFVKDGVDMEDFISYGFNVYGGNVHISTTDVNCVSSQNNYDSYITVYGGTLRLSNNSSGYIMYNPYKQYSGVKFEFNLGDNVKIYDLLTDSEISDINSTSIYEMALGDYLFSYADSDMENSDWLIGDESIPYVTFDEEGNKVIKNLTSKTENGVILSDPFLLNDKVDEIISNASKYEGKIWIVIDTGCKLSGIKQIDGDINFVVTSRGSLDLTELKLVYSKEEANFSVYYSCYHENSDSPFYFNTYKEKYLSVNEQGETEEKWIYNSTNDYYSQRQVHYLSEMVGNKYVESGYDEWWIVDKNYTLNKTLWICGLNNIILKDGCTLTVEDVAYRLTFNTDKYINIYAQSQDPDKAGSLVVKNGINLSGIMADGFNVYGGNVSVYGGEDGCITSSNQYNNSISVYGGLLYLKCATGYTVYGSIRNLNVNLGKDIKVYNLTEKTEITHDYYQRLKTKGEFVIGDIIGTNYENIMNEGKFINYIDYDEDGNGQVKELILSAKNVFTFSNTENGFEEMTETLVPKNVIDNEIWFIIEGEVKVSDSYKINDKYDVKIILTDGAKLTFENGIYLTSKNSLTIYATSNEKAVMGEMLINNKENMPAIGSVEDCGTFNVYGGNILIKFDESKGSFGEGATVNVLGGFLTVEPKPSEMSQLLKDDDYFIFDDEEYEYLTVDEMGESVEKTLTIDDGYVYILTDTFYIQQNLDRYFGYSAYEKDIWLVLSDGDDPYVLTCDVWRLLNVYNDLNILLLNGAEITFNELNIEKNCRLNIYAQSTNYDEMGVLNINQVTGEGILTVYGGRVNALPENFTAPLSKNVAVYGGLLRAVGIYSEGAVFSNPFEECIISTGTGIFAYTGESLNTSNFYGTGRLILTSRAGIEWYKRESSQYAYSYKDENGVHQCFVEPYAIGKTWEVYSGKVTEISREYVSDSFNILLTSGCEVTFNEGIDLGNGETLNFYSQTDSAKFAGKAHIIAQKGKGEIGVGSKWGCGTINFYGGVIDITAYGNAIGHTVFDVFDVNFYGGFVTLTSTNSNNNINNKANINIYNDLPVYDVNNGIYRISSDPINSLKWGDTVAVGNSSLVKLTSTINGMTFEDAEDFERYLMQNPDLNVYEISLGFDVETISTIKFNGNITIDMGGFNWTFACPNYQPAFKSTAKWGTFTLLGGETKDNRSTLEASLQSMCSFLETGGNVHIENAIFKNFYANEKGALINGKGAGTINIEMQNVDVISCYAKSIGGAIFLDDYNQNINSNGTMINLTCCKFENCYAESGGAIYIYDGTTIIKGDKTEFLGCHATNGGGGAIAVVDREGKDGFYYYGHAWDRNPDYSYISGFTFTNCFAGYSVKGVAVYSDIVAHKSGVFNGGAIYLHAGGYNVRNCDFQNCMAGNCGGGIFVEQWDTRVDADPRVLWRLPYVENCRFNECKAANNAYDIFLVFPKLSNVNAYARVLNCTFVHSDSLTLCSKIGVGGSVSGVAKSMMILGNDVASQNNTATQSSLVGSAVASGTLWLFITLFVVLCGAVITVIVYKKKKTISK